MARSRLLWAIVGLLTGLALAGLAAYFVKVGLDDADKTASVIGAFIGLIGLGLAGYGIVLSRQALLLSKAEPERTQDSGSATPEAKPAPGSQVVSNSWIGGDNIQIGQARDVNIDRRRDS
ncbi:hypothetical protein [Acrocarpospora catenulata]|uniref:hypothetical protein n=1 Tax=Acrocarpospora catenulata TaxID=2836182 RepID=UPI001BDB43C6|nr:hypothetical protein [Acrocarpospora catenulata]